LHPGEEIEDIAMLHHCLNLFPLGKFVKQIFVLEIKYLNWLDPASTTQAEKINSTVSQRFQELSMRQFLHVHLDHSYNIWKLTLQDHNNDKISNMPTGVNTNLPQNIWNFASNILTY
jgi:hypothetical protein